MAQGYETKPGGRQSFAFQGAAPVQTQVGPSGRSAGAQVIGGNSQSGANVAGPQTNAGTMTAGLGEFIDNIMEPHVQRKQRERFFEGYTQAQSGVALDELTDNDSPLTKIFGPSGFEAGAQFYTAKTAIDTWTTNQMSDMDRLRRLSPQELAKELASTSQTMMTGDPFADDLIQSGLLEASGPMLNTVAKERYAWQQETAVNAMSQSAMAGATLLQQTLVSQAAMSNPTADDQAIVTTTARKFLTGMAKPEGMSEDSYLKTLKGFMRGAMQDGNFYAVELLRKAGIDSVLSEEDRTRLDDTYLKYANKALGRAAGSITKDLIALDTNIKTERISPNDAAAELSRLNGLLKRQTGVDIDLFDYEDIRGTAGSVVDVLVSSQRRLEARAWQVEDNLRRRQWGREDDAADEAEAAAQTSAAWGMGQVRSAVAGGLKEGDFNILANQSYADGDYAPLVTAYATDGWTSPLVANKMQASIGASIGEEFTKDFARGYNEWDKLNRLRPAAASAYFGSYHPKLQAYQSLVASGTTPQMAYLRTFADAAVYTAQDLPKARRREAETAIKETVAGTAVSWYNPWRGRGNLNASGTAALTTALTSSVARSMANTNVSAEALAKEQIEVLHKSGAYDRAGAFAWTAPVGTPSLQSLTKMQDADFDRSFTAMLDYKLKASGTEEGADIEDYVAVRLRTPDGKEALFVDPVGETPGVIITVDELVRYQTEIIGGRGTGKVRSNVNPYRRIPGESGWDRTVRINKEVAAGASPIKP